MGIKQRPLYTIYCDIKGCTNQLEDYTGDLVGMATTRDRVAKIAKEQGFKQLSERKWACPDCVHKHNL